MDGGVRYLIRHTGDTNAMQALAAVLDKCDLSRVKNIADCEFLLLHRRTDAPGRALGVQQKEIDDLRKRGGVYAEYTTSTTPWEVLDSSHYYGGHAELRTRLERLAPPVTLDDVRRVLGEPAGDLLPALAILCQGYLAAHATWDENKRECGPGELRDVLQQMGLEETLKSDPSFAGVLFHDRDKKQAQVCEPGWWLEVVGFPPGTAGDENHWRDFQRKLSNEWGKLPLPDCLKGLLAALRQSQIHKPNLIADVYRKLAARLGGQSWPRG